MKRASQLNPTKDRGSRARVAAIALGLLLLFAMRQPRRDCDSADPAECEN
jgi:hypothetical protein